MSTEEVSLAANLPTEESEVPLFSSGFIILTAIFLFASSAMAAFFQLQPYLQSIHVNQAWIGFIIAADSLAGFIIQPFCAPYLHPFNARRWMAAGIILMAGSLIAYTTGKGILALSIIRIVQGTGFVTFLAAMMAAIVVYIPQSKSGRGFGILSLVRLVPYALVPPAVSYLVDNSIDFPTVLVGFALIISLSLLLLLRLPRHDSSSDHGPQVVGDRNQGTGKANRPVGMRGAIEGLKDRRMQTLLLVNVIVFVCYTIVFFYISGFGKQAGLTGARLFFTIATVMMVAIRLLGSTLFDKLDKARLVSWCLAVLSVSFVFIPYTRDWSLLCLAAVFGLSWGIVMPLLNALVFDASPPHLRGLNVNLTLVAMQGGFFLGPLAGGLVVAAYGYTVLFVLCGPLTLLALAALVVGNRSTTRPALERCPSWPTE